MLEVQGVVVFGLILWTLIEEASGFSGGVWVLWKKTKFQVDVWDSNSQSITVKISGGGLQDWLLTGLYASPCYSTRQGLWRYLTAVSATTQLPWVVLGDFNELVNFSDKNGGSYAGKFKGLKEWVQREAMMDLGYNGASFTWSNGQVKERLDRGFCNGDWRTKKKIAGKNRWDSKVLLCIKDNQFLRKLEHSLTQQYETIRDHEAMLWKQKSREKWIKDGDRNTKNFHITTMVRRRRNKIDDLFYANGVWSEAPDNMKNTAMMFFQKLFAYEEGPDLRILIPSIFPTIEHSRLDDLATPVTAAEIKSALFSIGSLKAPGFDDESSKHQHPKMNEIPDGLNDTLITLVPKTESPKHMHLFRPISLCSTLYKIISKIIVARIRPILTSWISPNQVSFVPGRHISDNILITQEILHKCRTTKGKKGFMVWKIDLSKAYDKLRWSFIHQVLTELMIPDSLTKLIMHCITSTTFQVIVNGDLSSKLSAGRGVRQGDPLSPYIFVLCMENLSHLIQSAVEVGQWKPIQSSKSGPFVSHLFFADDLILFAEASTTQTRVLKKCMDIFCGLSGQSVNFEKSKLYCSPNIKRRIARSISRVCGSPLTSNLGKYLGMPLIHSRVNMHTYSELVDKVQNKLAGWKSIALNMARRLTLVQAVTTSTPIYAMQTTKLPASTCDTLDKIIGIFFGEISGIGILCDHAIDQSMVDKDLMVQDFWIGKEWDATLLFACLPSEIAEKILSIPIGLSNSPDKPIWSHSSTGKFSVKSAYYGVINPTMRNNSIWKSIWHLNIPPKLKIFTWLFVHKRLPTNVNRARRHLTIDSSCHCCPGEPETMLHLFRDCPQAMAIWKCFDIPATISRTFMLDWDGWISASILQKNCKCIGFNWSQLFIFICWFIWKWRNKVIFDANFSFPYNPTANITEYVIEWINANQRSCTY
ncbi:uncharacterized protein LOC133724594 [Rosa rugosa]|uniref:uncharacterized protein LOC133724594 n=1 Tax=Rosa rugosa TaxID=74645 RepID=UPI002B40C3E6|nr:uncharacterized protein LOC133724594 [Rosa rugosa]